MYVLLLFISSILCYYSYLAYHIKLTSEFRRIFRPKGLICCEYGKVEGAKPAYFRLPIVKMNPLFLTDIQHLALLYLRIYILRYYIIFLSFLYMYTSQSYV